MSDRRAKILAARAARFERLGVSEAPPGLAGEAATVGEPSAPPDAPPDAPAAAQPPSLDLAAAARALRRDNAMRLALVALAVCLGLVGDAPWCAFSAAEA